MQFQVQAKIHKMVRRSATLRQLGQQNYTAPLTMYLHICANFQPNWRSRGSDTARKRKAPMRFNIHLKVQLTVTPKNVKPLLEIQNHISNYSQIWFVVSSYHPQINYCNSTYGVNIHLKVQLTVTPKKMKPLLGILNHISNYSQIWFVVFSYHPLKN